MIERPWAGSRSGSLPLTSGSGSGSRRPKNIRIRLIRIRNFVVKSKTAHQRSHFFIRLCCCREPPATWSLSWKQKGRGRGRSTSRGRRTRTGLRRSSSTSSTNPKPNNPAHENSTKHWCAKFSVQYRALYGRWSIFFYRISSVFHSVQSALQNSSISKKVLIVGFFVFCSVLLVSISRPTDSGTSVGKFWKLWTFH